MKKIALLGALALCLGFTSCDNYEEPNPPAQSNPQDAILEANGISIAPGESVTAGTISLPEYDYEGVDVAVANVTFTAAYPADYTIRMDMELSDSEAFTTVQQVATSYADGVVTATPGALQAAFENLFGKAPAVHTAYARFAAYAVSNTPDSNSEARIGGADLFYGPITMSIQPMNPAIVIEDAYYLIGTACNWQFAQAIKFNHSDASPYDDPNFSVIVEITADQAGDGWEWEIIPASTYANGNWTGLDNSVFGLADEYNDSPEGELVGMSADVTPYPGVIYEEGTYLLEVNMENLTYSFSEAVPNLWTPGPANGWDFNNPMMLLATHNYMDYMGYVYVNGEVKFTSAPNWSAKYNLGAGDEPGTLANGSNDNIQVDTNGLYWIKINLPKLTLSMDLVETIGIIGDATPNGWDASTALTPSADYKTWSGDVTLTDGEFKFRANNGWDINLGGANDDLWQDGANLKSPGAGTYTITLNLGQLPYSCTLVKK